jgi:PAS domain S-box-containing protein
VGSRLTIDDIPQIAWAATSDGRMSSLNRAWYEYVGRRQQPAAKPASLEKRWWRAVHEDDRERGRRELLDGIKSEAPFRQELRLRPADGIERWFRISVRPVVGTSGKPKRWLGVCTDIDDYKRQGQQFAFVAQAGEALAESLDLNATLQRLLAIIVPQLGD